MKSHSSTIDNSRGTAKDLKVNLDELIRSAPSLSKDDLEQAKDKLMEQIASARRSSRMVKKIDEGIKQYKNYIAENPMKVIGVAVGLAIMALRSHLQPSIRNHVTTFSGDFLEGDCKYPNVLCFAGPDGAGTQWPDRCCDEGSCTGPNGYVSLP